MGDINDVSSVRGKVPVENPTAVFGFEDFWPKAYMAFKVLFDAIADLMRLGDEMVRAAEGKAAEPAKNVICALTRATMTGACEAMLLCGNGCGAGAIKIVRGMYESRWMAEYLRRHPEEVEDYLEFSKILLWRRLNWAQGYNPAITKGIPSDAMQKAEDDYKHAVPRFADSRGKVRYQWHRKSIGTIAKEIGREKEYDFPYAMACSIHHHNFEGLAAHFALGDDEEPLLNLPPSQAWVKQALTATNTNLWFALKTLNDSFGLDFRQRLDATQEVFLSIGDK